MDKAHPLSVPMIVRSLDLKKCPCRLRESYEDILNPEISNWSTIKALIYLVSHTRTHIFKYISC